MKFQVTKKSQQQGLQEIAFNPILPKSRISSRDQEIQLQVFTKVFNWFPIPRIIAKRILYKP